MRVLGACSLGGAGHLNPLVPFLDAALRRGDETLVVGPPALREMVERAGYPFRAGGEPPETDVAPIREKLPVVSRTEALVLGNRELFGRLAATAMLPAIQATCREWTPDLVLREPCEYASAVVAGQLGIPSAQVAISLSEGEDASITAAAPALEEHRNGLVDELRASPYLTRFPASLDRSVFPRTIRFHEPHGRKTDLPDWWDGSKAPLVYVSFGTVLGHMSIAADIYRTALTALGSLRIRVLMTVGDKFDRSSLDAVPANTRVEAWVPQAEVLTHADLVVCHGGSGTAFGALAAGVPVVVVPVFADQFENGRRIAEAGAGLVVESGAGAKDGLRSLIAVEDARRITGAIEKVLGDASYRSEAAAIAAEIAGAPSVDSVLEALLGGDTV